VRRFSPLIVLVVVTGLLAAYGNSHWSWLAGPIAAAALRALELSAREPASPAAARTGLRRAPAPVD
jgi:hypothetical protein